MTPRPHRHRTATSVLGATLAAGILALTLPAGPGTASASATGPALAGKGGLVAMHNELLSTDPPYGAKLRTGPPRITLTFDLPAQPGFSTLTVTGPDHNQWQAAPATEQGTTVSAPVRPLGPAGEYTVAWRIISADGHPIRATYPFSLTTPGPGTPAAPPNAQGSSTPTGSGGPPLWLWLAGAGVLLVAGAGAAVGPRRAREG